MKRIPILLSALVLTASTSAFAQNNAKAPPTPAQGAGIGQASQERSLGLGRKQRKWRGTLMQQREKGMSPEGASDAAGGKAATGKMKQ